MTFKGSLACTLCLLSASVEKYLQQSVEQIDNKKTEWGRRRGKQIDRKAHNAPVGPFLLPIEQPYTSILRPLFLKDLFLQV
jgi:hypothetical protein